MSPRTLGRSDLDIGDLAYGCWRLADEDVAVTQARIEEALDQGMTLIDTADVYGMDGGFGFGHAETQLGKVLRAAPNLRDRMVLARTRWPRCAPHSATSHSPRPNPS